MTPCVMWLCLSADLMLGQLPPPRLLPPDEAPPPLVLPAAPKPTRPITLSEFAANFKPEAGTYEVLFVHPTRGYAASVTFTLPPGSPVIRVHKRELEFDYGKHEVRIRFRIGGKIAVIAN